MEEATLAFEEGLTALKIETPESLVEPFQALTELFPSDYRMYQILGLAARKSTHSALAAEAFANAAKLAPNDPLIAHSHARTALEAGMPAVQLFKRASALNPNDGNAHLGLVAALIDEGRVGEATEYLRNLLKSNSLWLQGHKDYAHLLGQLGEDPFQGILASLHQQPGSLHLHELLIGIAVEAKNYAGAQRYAMDAIARFGETSSLLLLAAHIASERGHYDEADDLFNRLKENGGHNFLTLRARHYIRTERFADVSDLLSPHLGTSHANQILPYLSLAWRMIEDDRWAWLEGDDRFVAVHDFEESDADWSLVAEKLRKLHFAKAEPLDQSVRNGTQTNGNLLLRVDPAIQRVKNVIEKAVTEYVNNLPTRTAAHPFLVQKGKHARISGSWSVRLTEKGYHADHFHSEGWISSALYIVVPSNINDPKHVNSGVESHPGWLSLGECRELVPSLSPLRLIEPKRARLVLFPSFMWHGTRPFSSGERLTIAFDVARNQQD